MPVKQVKFGNVLYTDEKRWGNGKSKLRKAIVKVDPIFPDIDVKNKVVARTLKTARNAKVISAGANFPESLDGTLVEQKDDYFIIDRQGDEIYLLLPKTSDDADIQFVKGEDP